MSRSCQSCPLAPQVKLPGTRCRVTVCPVSPEAIPAKFVGGVSNIAQTRLSTFESIKCMVRATAPKSILIVDNNDYIRRIIRGFLEVDEKGLKVCGEAVDGYDAIEKAKQLKPDLIILDISLPRMNGILAASILKEMHPRTPIVLFN